MNPQSKRKRLRKNSSRSNKPMTHFLMPKRDNNMILVELMSMETLRPGMHMDTTFPNLPKEWISMTFWVKWAVEEDEEVFQDLLDFPKEDKVIFLNRFSVKWEPVGHNLVEEEDRTKGFLISLQRNKCILELYKFLTFLNTDFLGS
jgi:hypothetical protein